MSDLVSIEWAELLHKDEPLHPNLRPYIQKAESGMVMLNHPLVQQIMYHPQLNALINERFRHKQEAVAAAIEKKNWGSVLFLHERPYRLEVLMRHAKAMTDAEYWGFVGHVWTDSENIWQNMSEWRTLWEAVRPEKHLTMNEEERDVLASLPDTVTVYRGVHGLGATKKRSKKGMSWTLDREKAEWFSKRFQHANQMVLEGTVKKSAIHAYFAGRSEAEIVTTGVK